MKIDSLVSVTNIEIMDEIIVQLIHHHVLKQNQIH
jgi:hypothetical protein